MAGWEAGRLGSWGAGELAGLRPAAGGWRLAGRRAVGGEPVRDAQGCFWGVGLEAPNIPDPSDAPG